LKIKVIEIARQEKHTLIRAIVMDKEPEAGSIYLMEKLQNYSSQQRRLFEPLVKLYFDSLCFPSDWPCETWEDLRDLVKLKLGQGVYKYEYVDDKMTIQRVKTLEEIPDYVMEDFHNGNSERVRIFSLISTTKYTKKQMYEMTNSLIRQMIHGGVSKSKMAKKFNVILETIGFTE